jgi:predicted homoserine dehydrogenase-like protein
MSDLSCRLHENGRFDHGLVSEDVLLEGLGIVDYVLGQILLLAFLVFGVTDHPIHQHYLNLYKLGQGPIYCFYRPYHYVISRCT